MLEYEVDMDELRGRTALITGASSDIGHETAKLLARAGARLALVGRSLEPLEARRADLDGAAGVELFAADLRDGTAIESLHSRVVERAGDPDVLVHAAGVWHDGGSRLQGPLLQDTPPAVVDDVLDVGLRAPILLARLVLPAMILRRAGKIVCMSCGFAGAHEAVGWLHYYVANLAVRHFVEGLAAETRPNEIQVNAVAPWFVATGPVRRFYPAEAARALAPVDVARLIAFLVSPSADHVSGQVIELRTKADH